MIFLFLLVEIVRFILDDVCSIASQRMLIQGTADQNVRWTLAVSSLIPAQLSVTCSTRFILAEIRYMFAAKHTTFNNC